ncbi:glycosyltransferase [Streptomyces mirabilis]|uniref:glycosyltransferase n=1 Tax=Streptomyces mirabilis TaxID=68239 RepID=UPI000BE3854A
MLSFWDGGEGHLARVAHLVTLLRERGDRCLIISSSAKAARVRTLTPEVEIVEVDTRPESRLPAKRLPQYSHAFRHAQRRLALGFNDQDFVTANTGRVLEVLRAFRPHVVVNDYHDTLRIAAEAAGVPVVSLAMAHGLRSGPTLGAWKIHELADRPLPECLRSFNHTRAQWNLAPYTDERETFEGDLNLIPSCPELDPVQQRTNDVYVGPVMTPPAPPQRRPRRRPLVVSYLAEGNNRPDSAYPRALAALVRAERNLEFAVMGSARYARYFRTGETFLGMVPAQRYLDLLDEADLVITHGGTTLVHALERSVPVLCLPWTSSEAAWAVRAEEHGAGMLYPAYRRPLEWRVDDAVHPSTPLAGHWSLPISAQGLSRCVRRILEEPGHRAAAADLAERLSASRSRFDLVDLVRGAGR